MNEAEAATMDDIAEKAKAIKARIRAKKRGDGTIKTMRDGTRYRITARGWKKMLPETPDAN